MMKMVIFMTFTSDQISLIEKLEKGLNYSQLSENEQRIIWFLDSLGIAQPRADISDGFYELSEYGKQALAEHRKAKDDELAQRQLMEQVAAEKAEQKRQQRFENKIAVANLLIPLITFFLGILVEHYARILDWLTSLF